MKFIFSLTLFLFSLSLGSYVLYLLLIKEDIFRIVKYYKEISFLKKKKTKDIFVPKKITIRDYEFQLKQFRIIQENCDSYIEQIDENIKLLERNKKHYQEVKSMRNLTEFLKKHSSYDNTPLPHSINYNEIEFFSTEYEERKIINISIDDIVKKPYDYFYYTNLYRNIEL